MEDELQLLCETVRQRVEESEPGGATGMILSLRESLQSCKDMLAACEADLEATKSEVSRWKSAFGNELVLSPGRASDPCEVVSHLRLLKSSEDSLREQLEKANKKEAAFIVTFAKRDQEIAELKCTLRDLKAQLKPSSMQARRLLLDPAIHEEFARLKTLVEEKERRVKELEENIGAVNFTPQSKKGKMLMARCRDLQSENEDIGQLHSDEKIRELAMKLVLQKSQTAQLQSQLAGLCEYVKDFEDDVEKSNEMGLQDCCFQLAVKGDISGPVAGYALTFVAAHRNKAEAKEEYHGGSSTTSSGLSMLHM